MSSVSFTIVKPHKKKLALKKKKTAEQSNLKNVNTKNTPPPPPKKRSKIMKMKMKRTTPSWELLLEAAIRAEQVGRLGIEVYGRFYSAKEIEGKCRHFHPLPPFTRLLKSACEIAEAEDVQAY